MVHSLVHSVEKKSVLLILFCLPLAGIFYWMKMNGIYFSWLSGHLNDLLSIPLIISLVTLIMRKILLLNFIPDGYKILALTLSLSIFFEWLLPAYSAAATADFTDVICYFVSGGMTIAMFRRV